MIDQKPEMAEETEIVSSEQADEIVADVHEKDEPEKFRLSREAANYRRQLRDVEEERNQLTSTLKNVQQEHFQSVVFGDFKISDNNDLVGLKDPADFERFIEKAVDDFITEEGLIDVDAVRESMMLLYQQRPELFVSRNKTLIPIQVEMDQSFNDSVNKLLTSSSDFGKAFQPNR